MIGDSAALALALDEISRLAPINRPILVLGERGTGKELAADRLHFLSRRWDAPLLKVQSGERRQVQAREDGKPALYCSRTVICDHDVNAQRFSPDFKLPPSFKPPKRGKRAWEEKKSRGWRLALCRFDLMRVILTRKNTILSEICAYLP